MLWKGDDVMDNKEKEIIRSLIGTLVQVIVNFADGTFADGFTDIFTEEDYKFYSNDDYEYKLKNIYVNNITNRTVLTLIEN